MLNYSHHLVHSAASCRCRFRPVSVLLARSHSRGCQSRPRRQAGRSVVVVRAAMFDALSLSLDRAWKLVSKQGRLSKENIAAPLKEIRSALLEADVSLPVVRRFMSRVEEKALGQEVIPGVSPDTALVKVVNDELVTLMGSAGAKGLEPGKPQIILMAGLQGVGKTTAAAKLATYLKKQGKSVLLVATDVYRPAAIDQLKKLGASIVVPVFELGTERDPVDIAKRGMDEARRTKADVVIVDTAGRLQVDADMMKELKSIKSAVRATDTLLVVDAMTGQEAANLVKAFNDEIGITGAVLTKMDGDSRGGAALCVHEVSGKPVKFVGVGESLDTLEPFYPERMAGRILGKGDVLTLYEKSKAFLTEEDMKANVQRLMSGKFDFTDFLKQFKSMKDMGGMQMLKMMPGFTQVSDKDLYLAEKKAKFYEAMMVAMTPEEREDPMRLQMSPAARHRIAKAVACTEGDVSQMLTEFEMLRAKTRQLADMMRSQGGVGDPEAAMKELAKRGPPPAGIAGAPGAKAPKRKERPPKVVADKSKGFGAAAAKK